MGVTVIARRGNVLSFKFVFPLNLGTVKANTAFKIKMTNDLEVGHFFSTQSNYYAGP